jgi:hypothetical protein
MCLLAPPYEDDAKDEERKIFCLEFLLRVDVREKNVFICGHSSKNYFERCEKFQY